jgi:hypothetical protein
MIYEQYKSKNQIDPEKEIILKENYETSREKGSRVTSVKSAKINVEFTGCHSTPS